ncbi:MAG: hypothetical protein INR71_01625 [Terriglobus roseus]|nr:hypothetical protein [Terriglobus roseus]
MRTFVQDSDDDTEALSSPVRARDGPAEPDGAAPLAGHAPYDDGNGDSSTGTIERFSSPLFNSADVATTEQLRLDMQRAHDALFASQRGTKRGPSSTSNDASSPDRTKRRKTATEALQSRRHAASSARSRSTGSGYFDDQFAAIAAVRDADERRGADGTPGAWRMPGSLMDDFAGHDPMALFPPTGAEDDDDAALSSTVPDNTFTQRRLLDEARAMEQRHQQQLMRGDEAGGQALRLHSTGSLGSSAFRTTQATKSPSDAKSSAPGRAGTVDGSQVVRQRVDTLEERFTPEGSPNVCLETGDETPSKGLPGNARHAGGSSSQEPISTTPQGSPSIAALGVLQYPRARETATSSTRSTNTSMGRSVSSPSQTGRRPTTEDDTVSAQRSTKVRRKRDSVKALTELANAYGPDKLDSDEIAAIGLPAEQYKPRPSRSRSSRAAPTDDADTSVVPERAARARARRRWTAGATREDEHALGDKDKTSLILDMGFTPSRVKKALMESNGNMEEAVEVLVSSRAATEHEGIANEIATALKTYSPKKETNASPSDRGCATTTGPTLASKVMVSVQIPPAGRDTDGAQKVDCDGYEELQAPPTSDIEPEEVRPPVKKRPGRPRKGLPKALTEDDAIAIEADDRGTDGIKGDAAENPARNDEERPTKKRGRGRPKSTSKAEKETIKIHRDAEDATTADPASLEAKEEEAPHDTALRETNGNTPVVEAAVSTDGPAPSTPCPGAVQKTQVATPASSPVAPPAPRTPVEARGPAQSAQQSPGSKGKVSYRVGLSRNARIPSLLKVRRK